MNSIREKVASCLMEKIDEEDVLIFIKNKISDLNEKREKSAGKIAYRMINSLKNTKNRKASWKDFCSNLRQYILFFNDKVDISLNILKYINIYLDEFKLINNNGTINAINVYPSWFEYNHDLDNMYAFEERKENIESIGDSILYNLTGYMKYNSLGQKLAIYKSLQLKGGETLLASLPTGGGKSLVGQIPMLVNRSKNKTAIVIVPTIALAIDQEHSSRKLFEGNQNYPKAYHSGMSIDEKMEVIDKIKKGVLPILYVSPEAILNKPLYDVVLEAAENNIIEYFIIDESHIVLDWGEAFRPEFQFLTLLRKKLVEKTNNNLKTILLSATLSDEATVTLKNLFSDNDNFIQVRGDSLRNELMIWSDKSKNQQEREYKLLEIIHLLPRPMIIYVNKKIDSKKWELKLQQQGYKSVSVFTGDTPTTDREVILEQWDAENIDIIIATSAFGMGVDKDNVRVVIHACIPESINRYYQEIGRAGRDGYPAICLLSSVEGEDLNDVHELTKGAVATTQNIMDRWKGIIKKIYHSQNGNEMWIDIYNSKPEHLQYDSTGSINAYWNKYVLLFMLRLNFIEVVDMDIDFRTKKFNFLIKIIDFDLYNNYDLLNQKVDELREIERQSVNYEIESMKYLALDHEEECFSYKILEVYREAAYMCGGCPSCRREKRYPSLANANVRIEGYRDETISEEEVYNTLRGSLRRYLSYNKELYIYYDRELELLYKIHNLVNNGVRNIVIDESLKKKYYNMIKYIDMDNENIYSIYTYKEVYENELERILEYATALFYDDNIEEIYKCDLLLDKGKRGFTTKLA